MMSLLSSLLTNAKFGGSDKAHPAKAASAHAGGGGLQLYPGDAQNFLKWGSIGFLGFGLYQMAVTLAKRNVNPCVGFKDPVEAMNTDPLIRDSLLQMQNYRDLNPWLFKTALQNIDQLLFLEHILLSQKAQPVKKDKDIAFTHFRMGVNRLSQFQFLVRKEMGNEHGMTINLLVKRVYTQMQKHLLNVLHLCSEFRPENLIARAPVEVVAALRRMDEDRAPENSYARWEELRGRLDTEVQATHSHRRHHTSRRHRHTSRRRQHSSDRESDSPPAPLGETETPHAGRAAATPPPPGSARSRSRASTVPPPVPPKGAAEEAPANSTELD